MTSNRRPIACTLTAVAADRQLTEWTDLVAELTSIEQVAQGVRLTVPAGLVEAARDLADREAGCCAFLSFASFDLADGGIELTITSADPAGVPVVRLLAGLESS